jgi:broad specificity phosphatase PhoE
MSDTRHVILVRHGESEANAGAATEDAVSCGLTPRGHRQARAVAASLEQVPDLIVVSSFLRARETAEETRRRFPCARVEEWPVHEFHYLGTDAYRGTSARQRRPARDEYWRALDPERVCEPGAESFAAFLSRVHAVRDRLESASERQTVVFGHKKFIHALMWSWAEGRPAAAAAAMARYRAFDRAERFPNGAAVDVELGSGTPRVSAVRTQHLAGADD